MSEDIRKARLRDDHRKKASVFVQKQSRSVAPAKRKAERTLPQTGLMTEEEAQEVQARVDTRIAAEKRQHAGKSSEELEADRARDAQFRKETESFHDSEFDYSAFDTFDTKAHLEGMKACLARL